MQESYENLIEKLKGKKILFCGLGKSNLPFVNMLTNEKIPVTAYDVQKKEKLNSQTVKELEQSEYINLRAGDESVWNEYFDVIIRTPGMNFLSHNLTQARKNGTAVTSEIELFFDVCPCATIGITGSDGKTTVSTVISEILKNDGFKVHLGGNIGKPLLPEIKNINKNDIAVIELSSFQLMSMRKSPDISVITNISPNHLDVHANMNEYVSAKKQILLHQNAFSKTVLNYDNLSTRIFSDDVRGETLFFSAKEKINHGTWIDKNSNIVFSKNGKDKSILNTSEIKIPGGHNVENYLAAIASVFEFVNPQSIKKTAISFAGVQHRIEFVRNFNGISFYNDSIASSPTRTTNGTLSLFDKKITLIAGGYDKKIPFDTLAKKIIEKVSVLILMGDTAEAIEKEVKKSKEYDTNILKIIKVRSMEEAVKKSLNNTGQNGTVVLSPACASFDLYKNFEERGNHFKNIVNSLK